MTHYTVQEVVQTLEKTNEQTELKMGNRASKACRLPDGQPPTGTPAGFPYTADGNNACKYLTKWERLTKDDLGHKWPKL